MVDRTNNALPNTTYDTPRYKDILRHTCARNEAVGCQGERRCVMQQDRKFACCIIFGHPYLLVAVHPSTQTRLIVLLNEARFYSTRTLNKVNCDFLRERIVGINVKYIFVTLRVPPLLVTEILSTPKAKRGVLLQPDVRRNPTSLEWSRCEKFRTCY